MTFSLHDLRRVRLKGGRHVHSVHVVGGLRKTGCGKFFQLYDSWDRPWDTALTPATAVTCPRCPVSERGEA